MSSSVGALWARKYQQEGEERTYWSGVINLGVLGDINIAVFKNDRKESDKRPDFRIVISEKGKENNTAQDNTQEPF